VVNQPSFGDLHGEILPKLGEVEEVSEGDEESMQSTIEMR
jgi:hypothetical protein